MANGVGRIKGGAGGNKELARRQGLGLGTEMKGVR